MPEVEIGREAACRVGLGAVALIDVSVDTLIEKFLQGGSRGRLSSAGGNGSHGVVDRQFSQQVAVSRK